MGRTRPNRCRWRRGGFTLPEMILGVAITSLVGLAVATVSAALSNAYDAGSAQQQSLQAARTAMLRTEKAVRQSALVLAAWDNNVLLWEGDRTGDGFVNISEVTLLIHYSDGTLYEVTATPTGGFFGSDWAVHLDTAVTWPDLVVSLIEWSSGREIRQTGGELSSFRCRFDTPPPESRLVQITLTAGATDPFPLRSAVGLRACQADGIGYNPATREWEFGYEDPQAQSEQQDDDSDDDGGNGNGNGRGNGNGNGRGNGNGNGGGNNRGGNGGGNGNGNGNGRGNGGGNGNRGGNGNGRGNR